ncbi:ATP-dependent DNA helicase [Trichonephila clavipes]|nr:ATP-dependent DNA helicase [Trichonephila clavipes]
MLTDPENYFHSLLVQYVPFYSEDELIDEHNNARKAFLTREQQLRQTNAYLETHRQIEIAFNQAHAFNLFENPEETVEAELEDEVTEQAMTNQQFQNLPPIRRAQAFHQPERFFPAINLWRLFSLVELAENMRQQGDTLDDLLNALRVSELKVQHFALLESKMLTEASGNFDLDRVIRIYRTRAQVDAHNIGVLDRYQAKEV